MLAQQLAEAEADKASGSEESGKRMKELRDKFKEQAAALRTTEQALQQACIFHHTTHTHTTHA